MKKNKKLLSAVLAVGMTFGLMPGKAISAEYINSVDYRIDRHDHSWIDNGQLKLLHYYDQVVLEAENEQANSINQDLQQRYNEFYKQVPEKIQNAQIIPPGVVARDYDEAQISKNEDGILSVKMNYFGNYGGVNWYGTDGLNYNLNTGTKLDLTELCSLSSDGLAEYFKNQTMFYLYSHPEYSQHYEALQEISNTIANYRLEDFDYYIEDHNIVVVYDKYEVTAGFMGMIEVPCPIVNNTIGMTLDGKALSFDQQPIIDNNRVMVPIRAIFEALGYTVVWDKESQMGTASNGQNTIKVQLNNAAITHNGGTYWCDVTPKVVSGRILVPIRAISESAGCEVFWNRTMKKVIIES